MMEDMKADIRNLDAETLAAAGPPSSATCVVCGASPLARYLTSGETGATYCPECAGRMDECK